MDSENHYAGAIEARDREFSNSVFVFGNSLEVYQRVKEWNTKIVIENDKNQIELSIEPTSHYFFVLLYERWQME